MLGIAAARGGELLKFGGDALLFLFRGDDHAEQACDAAVEMRVGLRAAAAVPTSVGRLSLSMSVGVHSGDVALFLVGAPTRELLVLGPAATETARAEKAADAGQVVVSPATASRLRPDATRPREDGQLVLRRRRPHSPQGAAQPVPGADDALLRTLFPVALGEYLAPGPPDPEHRVATIAFVRFSGTDAILAEQGPGPLAEALHAVVTTVEAALAAEGVTLLATDLDTDGGKFFLGTGRAEHPRGRRGPDAARPAPDRRRRPAPPPPARRQPWPRLRGRGRCRATRGLLGHGRHHQHGGPDHGHGADRRHPRAPRCAGALPHPLRRDTCRSLRDEGQGRSHVGLRRRRGDRHPRGRRRLPPALPRPGGGDCDRPCGRSRRR